VIARGGSQAADAHPTGSSFVGDWEAPDCSNKGPRAPKADVLDVQFESRAARHFRRICDFLRSVLPDHDGGNFVVVGGMVFGWLLAFASLHCSLAANAVTANKRTKQSLPFAPAGGFL
jgi:hypothetical protein